MSNEMTLEKLQAMLPASAFTNKRDGKFAPKLDFTTRCAILALYKHAAINRRILAAAFQIDRRTVTHIVNPASPHYKDVRRELDKYGAKELFRAHVTEDISNMVAEAAKTAEVKLSDHALRPEMERDAPSIRATGKAGLHTVQPEQCEHTHRVEIAWKEAMDGLPAGWWCRDLDCAEPDTWFHNGEDSLKTSAAAFTAMLENLIDE